MSLGRCCPQLSSLASVGMSKIVISKMDGSCPRLGTTSEMIELRCDIKDGCAESKQGSPALEPGCLKGMGGRKKSTS